MEAAVALINLYVDIGDVAKAEAVLKQLDSMSGGTGGGSPDALKTRVKVYLKLDRLTDALAARDELAARKDAEVKDVFNTTLEVADAYYQSARRLRDEAGKTADEKQAQAKVAEAGRYDRVTADLLAKALPLVEEAAKTKIGAAELIAKRSFRSKGYVTAISAVDKVEALYKATNRDEDRDLWNLRLMKVECYDRMNHWPPKAVALLDRVAQYKAFAGLLDIKKLRAAVLENNGQWAEALNIWNELSAGLDPGTPVWFESYYRRAQCYYKLRDIKRGNQTIDGLEVLHPTLGGPEMKKKFLDLRAEYNR
jgi:tetratricopeptide (TPR) repeat protein